MNRRLILIGLMSISLGVVVWFFWPHKVSVTADLGLPPIKMNVLLWKEGSSLTSETKCLKAILSKSDSKQLQQWLPSHKAEMRNMKISLKQSIQFDILKDVCSNSQWTPQFSSESFRGTIILNDWHCDFMINSVDNKTDVLYFYAIDFFN